MAADYRSSAILGLLLIAQGVSLVWCIGIHRRLQSWCPLSSQFVCDNGQCINTFSLCDGRVDCQDGSDETLSICSKSTCPRVAFQCSYGACIDFSKQCDGNKDCADNSDELSPECNKTSNTTDRDSDCRLINKLTCESGQCVSQFAFCDGVVDCQDGSDESFSRCESLPCPSMAYKCNYGACIEKSLICNGVSDCHDGSDEMHELCRNSPSSFTPRPPYIPESHTPPPTRPTQEEAPRGACRLPTHPKNGKYTVHPVNAVYQFDTNSPLGRGVSGTLVDPFDPVFLNFTCNQGFVFDSPYQDNSSLVSVCFDSSWIPNPSCQKLCPPITSNSFNPSCEYLGETVDCSHPVLAKTQVRTSCRLGFVRHQNHHQSDSAKCLSTGLWDRDLTECTPVCGVRTKEVSTLISFGEETERGQFPWHVGIYWLVDGDYIFKCGGTIVNQFSVITAAHCIHYEKSENRVPHSMVFVTAGKHYSNYRSDEEFDYRSQARSLIIPPSYHGPLTYYESDLAVIVVSRPFLFSQYIMPICMDWKKTHTNLPGSSGTVVGWGMDESGKATTEELKSSTMTYLEKDYCYHMSASHFQSYIIADKFCASYSNGSGVQAGDSGGGYVVNVNGTYFLYGVVSLKLGGQSTFALFTDFTPTHLMWLKKVTSTLSTPRNLHYRPKPQKNTFL